MRKSVLICFALLMVFSNAEATTGISGRVAWHGVLIEGVTIRAYADVAKMVAGRPVAVSQPTATDGTYQLDLPPGRYVLTARDFDGEPQAGRYFSYYNGSPIQVFQGRRTHVGFNLVRIPEPVAPQASKRSGLTGTVSFQGAPSKNHTCMSIKMRPKGLRGRPISFNR